MEKQHPEQRDQRNEFAILAGVLDALFSYPWDYEFQDDHIGPHAIAHEVTRLILRKYAERASRNSRSVGAA